MQSIRWFLLISQAVIHSTNMKRLALLLGLVMFIAGIVFTVHPSFEYQKHDEVAKIGPITATVEKHEALQVPVPVTVALLVAGLVLTVFGARSKYRKSQ